ncbi:MAG: hypothetical protein JWM98_3348 [Thermoleophilia bacterium]|nr:hypothetical protein [Thermoleophilia bacterium]
MVNINLGPAADPAKAAFMGLFSSGAKREAYEAISKEATRIDTSFNGRVFDGHAADPSVTREPGGPLHMYVSNNFDYTTVEPMGGELLRVPLMTSEDGVNFVPRGDSLSAWPEWMEPTADSVWAPFVQAPREKGGEWRMYMTGLVKGTKPEVRPGGLPDDTATAMIEGNGKRGIGLATSTDGYTFTPKGDPLVVSRDVFDGIDPFVLNHDGTDYLYWGSSGHPIRAQQLSEDGAKLLGEPVEVAHPAPHVNQGYMNLIEAAEPIKNPDGSWSLIVSGDDTIRDHYNVSEMRGASPFGPFEPVEGRLVEELEGVRSGPGHHESIVDDAGQRWMYLHAYDHDAVTGTDLSTRKLHMLQMDWTGERWKASIPTDRAPVYDVARGADLVQPQPLTGAQVREARRSAEAMAQADAPS